MLHLQPDSVFDGVRFTPGLGVTIGDDGRVVALQAAPPEGTPIARLAGQALLPGFVNSHSHVFQRLLRGRVEGAAGGASFWSWRDRMYALAAALGPDDVEAVATLGYQEMLAAGYTSVKEFHYLHHAPGGTPYTDVHELSLRIAAAAERARIALTLLRVAYPVVTSPEQRRFADPDVETALARTAELASRVACPVGIAPHSVRAVPPDGLRACSDWARLAHAECHVHVAEQPREVAWSLETLGARPVALLARLGVLGPHVTAVHAIHVDDAEVAALGAAGVTACLCPTTEANLGDGVSRTSELLAAGARLAIGSDSQAEIDPFAELRLLEYNERNRLGRRQVLDPAALLASVTEPLSIGAPARLLALDLDRPALAGVPAADLAGAVVMGARADAIRSVWLGQRNVTPTFDARAFRALVERLT